MSIWEFFKKKKNNEILSSTPVIHIDNNIYLEIDNKGKSKKHFWRLVGRNGKVLAVSETYETKQACVDTATMVANSIIIINDLTK